MFTRRKPTDPPAAPVAPPAVADQLLPLTSLRGTEYDALEPADFERMGVALVHVAGLTLIRIGDLDKVREHRAEAERRRAARQSEIDEYLRAVDDWCATRTRVANEAKQQLRDEVERARRAWFLRTGGVTAPGVEEPPATATPDELHRAWLEAGARYERDTPKPTPPAGYHDPGAEHRMRDVYGPSLDALPHKADLSPWDKSRADQELIAQTVADTGRAHNQQRPASREDFPAGPDGDKAYAQMITGARW